ncbi:hypothetical protein FISHEDRAFT_69237 [Fistulina hepatica ATCC 64428]|uniref:Uncharacterized protein n=1 Tax=Fistulina hepatica ATCC 64428 TaxID=1128425 RepID=A0A0D7ANC8_9AGAR|nr:hypothetical protein FISHEDRAFT_69237 [Fistulina hepatica ATCC 64428]
MSFGAPTSVVYPASAGGVVMSHPQTVSYAGSAMGMPTVMQQPYMQQPYMQQSYMQQPLMQQQYYPQTAALAYPSTYYPASASYATAGYHQPPVIVHSSRHRRHSCSHYHRHYSRGPFLGLF